MAKSLTQVSSSRCFGGLQKIFNHDSEELKCKMRFSVYLPPQACGETPESRPVVYYLSGLTCTEENFIQKSGAQRYASELGLIIVGPDTSPRGLNIPGEEDSWDFGTGAGFYVDATEEPWKDNYRMYSYVTKELPSVIEANFPVKANARAITGHSMGGHGALTCALKNPGLYRSVSAFAPICNPSLCPWGIKAFSGYLGSDNKEAWKEHDATELVAKYSGGKIKILVDSGLEDDFYKQGQLLTENFMRACEGKSDVVANVRLQEGYDHSYYFVGSFIGEHLAFHAKNLQD